MPLFLARKRIAPLRDKSGRGFTLLTTEKHMTIYCEYELLGYHFIVKKENFRALFNTVMQELYDKDDAEYEGDNSIKQIFIERGFELSFCIEDDISGLYWDGEDNAPDDFFAIIAPFVEPDSYLRWREGDHEWKWLFDGKTMREVAQVGTVWENELPKPAFYSDIGGPVELKSSNEDIHLDRYAVWGVKEDSKLEVLALGDNLDELHKRYGELPLVLFPSTPLVKG